MPRSTLRILHCIINPVFEPDVQRDWVSALMFFLFFYDSFGRFCFLSGCWIGHTYLSTKKRKNSIGPTLNTSTSAWITPCQKIKSKFEKLMGAWPIRPLNIFMSGPALTVEKSCVGSGRLGWAPCRRPLGRHPAGGYSYYSTGGRPMPQRSKNSKLQFLLTVVRSLRKRGCSYVVYEQWSKNHHDMYLLPAERFTSIIISLVTYRCCYCGCCGIPLPW